MTDVSFGVMSMRTQRKDVHCTESQLDKDN